MGAIWENTKVFAENYILNVLKDIGVIDFFDITLLALVLFFIYRFVRERRAGKLLIGVGCILLLTFIGDAFDMPATKFLFSDLRQIGVIAIIILFQPELRSALEKVGGMPSSGIRNITADMRDSSARAAEIEALCTAVSDLSRDKVGALIVIERTTKLGDYIKSGVPLDASISAHLVRNIFFNKAPLHDGAVIIRNGRICAAGCFLPLTTRNDINKDLGTRHRAAIGISELSDAVVIVVSEETGTISVSIDGNLERNYNYGTLKQELNKQLMPQGQTEHSKKPTRKAKKGADKE